jgi:ABC-type uncharacterized transport system auxiliary subunit
VTPRLLPIAAVALFCGGCALLSKADPVSFRYFSPEAPSPPTGQERAAPATGPKVALRLGYVRGGIHLRERIVFRDSSYELGYYEDLRWTDRPEVFLRRALERTLFEDRRVEHAFVGSAPTLDVDLLDFEEVRAPRRTARLRAVFTLTDDRVALAERTITIERPVPDGLEAARPVAVAKALGEALAAAVQEIDDQVVAALAARAAGAAQ